MIAIILKGIDCYKTGSNEDYCQDILLRGFKRALKYVFASISFRNCVRFSFHRQMEIRYKAINSPLPPIFPELLLQSSLASQCRTI